MKFAHICQGIINATRILGKHTQLNNIYVDNETKSISWHGRKPGIIKGLYYPLEYQYLIDSQQYSLLLSDGSFFQFFYQYDKSENLLSARLAFYPRPLSTRDSLEEIIVAADDAAEREDDELFNHLYNWTEMMDLKNQTPSNTSHIRFDYDPKVTTHSPSHLQLSGLHDFRISANYFPQPLAFIQLCEATYSSERVIDTAGMAFERRHALLLKQPSELINLVWPTQD